MASLPRLIDGKFPNHRKDYGQPKCFHSVNIIWNIIIYTQKRSKGTSHIKRVAGWTFTKWTHSCNQLWKQYLQSPEVSFLLPPSHSSFPSKITQSLIPDIELYVNAVILYVNVPLYRAFLFNIMSVSCASLCFMPTHYCILSQGDLTGRKKPALRIAMAKYSKALGYK